MRKLEDKKNIENQTIPNQRSAYLVRPLWIVVLVAAFMAVIIPTAWSSSRSSSSFVPIINWSAATSLPQPIAGSNAIVNDDDNDGNDDHIYFVGGRTATGDPSNAVYVGTIGDDGNITAWTTTTALPQPLYLHSVDSTDTHIYVIGGWKGSDPMQAAVYRAAFLGNGQLGAWVVEPEYPTKVNQHGSVIINDRLYGVGGFNGTANSTGISDVYFATINPDGSLGAWQATTSLPFPVRRHAVVGLNNKIYVTGGIDANSSAIQNVYVATVQNDGTLSSWTIASTMPQAIFYHRAVVHDGQLVIMGGKSLNDGPDLNSVYGATIANDGSLGAWQALPALPKGVFRFATVSARRWGSDYLFALGGGQGSNNSPTVITDVYYSDIPPTPTPTPPPTATPTPTPPVIMQINVENSPSNWVAPGEEITYNIDYRNLGPGTASSPLIQAMIPVNTEFVSGSSVPTESSITSTTAGGTIRWNLDAMNASQAGTLTYKVRRVAAASNQPPSALSISLDGPIAATAGQPINYTLTITNQAIQLDNAVITVHVPDEAEYVSSSNNGVFSNGVITWQAPTFPVATLSLNFALSASATFVLHEYRVEAEVPPPGGPAITRGIGSSLLVTAIDGLPHTGNGDGITIVNDEIRISWNYNGNPAAFTALGVQNPSLLDEKIFLPYLTQ